MRFEKRRNQDRDRVKKHTGHTSVRLGRRGPSIFKKIRAIDTRERREFRGMTPSSDLAAEQWTQFTPVDDPRNFTTRILLVIPNPSSNRFAQCFSNAFDRNPVEDLLEEAGDNHPDRFLACVPSTTSIKDQFLVDTTAG